MIIIPYKLVLSVEQVGVVFGISGAFLWFQVVYS
jgi:hypothetical protein